MEAILINCGVNDIDYSSAVDVHKSIIDTINNIKFRCPDIKVIVSEITPRKDAKDAEVIICNQMLNNSVKSLRNVILIKHDNLRDNSWSHFHNTKHIKKRSVPLFSANIKAGLREAYGMAKTNFENNLNNGDKYSHPIYKHQPMNQTVPNKPINDRMKNIAGYDKPKDQIINGIIDALKGLLR